MVKLDELSQAVSYAQTSGSGFGTRMLCRRLSIHNTAPIEASVWLSGLRRANSLNMNTNPVVNAHMRSPGGFVETFAGLRDGGEIGFEACFKNDAPRKSTNPDTQRWQAPQEGDDEDQKSFMHSIFYDREPFEVLVVPPQWTRGIVWARGYASMMGPIPLEMEAPVNFQGSFKVSGKPMLLRGNFIGATTTAEGVGIDAAAVDNLDGVALANNVAHTRYRAVSKDLLEEVWSVARWHDGRGVG